MENTMNQKLLYVLLLTTLILSACGPGKPATELKVDMTDFAFTPNQYAVPAGQEITLDVTHDGLVQHDFIIMKYGTEVGEHFNEEDQPNIYWQIEVLPGDSKTFTFIAPDQLGTYQIVCGMAGHVEAGMVGKLEVIGQ
jgi:uncharacterized cupredoxin-like copper-binding protein